MYLKYFLTLKIIQFKSNPRSSKPKIIQDLFAVEDEK